MQGARALPFSAAGEMAPRIAAFDWSASALGPLDQWPQSLKTTVGIVLNSRLPMCLWWGADLIGLYNDACIPLLGSHHPQALGRPAADSWSEIWPDIGPELSAAWENGQAGGTEALQVITGRDQVWEQRYLSLSYSSVHDECGQVAGLLCTLSEETRRVLAERRQAETALKASEERFRTLADNISQLAWMADPTGWIFWYNRRWYDYTGTTLEQMQGWGWKEVHHPDHVERVVARIQHAWDTGERWEDTFPLRGRDGRYHWFLSRAVPIRDAQGKIVRWFGTNTDVTEQRAAEEALRESDRRKDEFLATLAHELRNPLAPLISGLEILSLSESDSAADEEVLGMMERQLRQLVSLVDDLLDVSRISRGKIELQRRRLLLAEVVQSALEATRPLIEARHHRRRIDLPDEPISLEGDLVRLAQVFTNLLNNAAKYTEPGGLIELSAVRTGDRVRVAVKDDGMGVRPDRLPGIFDLFTQDRSPGQSLGGLGIGLHIVKRLTEMHGGTVEGRSAGRGRGSEFVVELPVAEAEPKREALAPVPPADTGAARHRILVADDNTDAADSIALVFRLLGNEVHTAYDGLDALRAAARLRPDIVVLDIGMPRLDGYQTAKRLRREPWGKDVVLVALSGWGQSEDRRRAREAGFDRHLLKPASTSALKKLLDTI